MLQDGLPEATAPGPARWHGLVLANTQISMKSGGWESVQNQTCLSRTAITGRQRAQTELYRELYPSLADVWSTGKTGLSHSGQLTGEVKCLSKFSFTPHIF